MHAIPARYFWELQSSEMISGNSPPKYLTQKNVEYFMQEIEKTIVIRENFTFTKFIEWHQIKQEGRGVVTGSWHASEVY